MFIDKINWRTINMVMSSILVPILNTWGCPQHMTRVSPWQFSRSFPDFLSLLGGFLYSCSLTLPDKSKWTEKLSYLNSESFVDFFYPTFYPIYLCCLITCCTRMCFERLYAGKWMIYWTQLASHQGLKS